MSSAAALMGMLVLASGVLAWQALRSVALQRVRFSRAEGQVGWQLDYGFDVSADGQQRRTGRIRFHRGALLWVEVPRGDGSRELWVVPGARDDQGDR